VLNGFTNSPICYALDIYTTVVPIDRPVVISKWHAYCSLAMHCD